MYENIINLNIRTHDYKLNLPCLFVWINRWQTDTSNIGLHQSILVEMPTLIMKLQLH